VKRLFMAFLASGCLSTLGAGTGEISLGRVDVPSCISSSGKGVSISAVIDSTPLDSDEKQRAVQTCASEARDFVRPEIIADDPVRATPVFREAFSRCMKVTNARVEVFSISLKSRCLTANSPALRGFSKSQCEARYQACLSKARSVDQCVGEEFPKRCIDTCMRVYGHTYAQCSSQYCLPTATNMAGWRDRCEQLDPQACDRARMECVEE
jgi:hypothetical protein